MSEYMDTNKSDKTDRDW